MQRAPSGFRPLLLLRCLTVVNDNLLRWAAIGLGKRAAGAAGTALVLTLGTAGFVLPFVVLAWLAGWLADRYPKRSVIAWCKFAEILIAGGAAAAIAWGVGAGGAVAGLPLGLWLLLATVTVIGMQAALLAPAVIGSIPETVPEQRLASANGVFALVTLAATLVGMAAGNILADTTPLDAAGVGAVPAGVALVGVAFVGWLAALALPRLPAADPAAPPPWNVLARTWADLRELATSRSLVGAAAGIVFFWAMASVAQLNVDQFAAESGSTAQGQVIPLLIALVGGIGLGSLVAGRYATRGVDAGSNVDLGFVPLGAAIMAVACFALSMSSSDVFGHAGWSAAWRLAPAVIGLALLGFGAGIFDVPLEAHLQERSPPARRGAILASTNLLVFAGIFAASLVYGGLRTPVAVGADAVRPLVSARGLFALFGLASLAACGVAVWAAPRETLRLCVAAIVHGLYRYRVVGTEHVPTTGPCVLVANHLSWLDGFLLPLSCPRPVRMVVYGPNIKGAFLRMLAAQWRFILFDPRPKSIGTALKEIQAGIAAGDVIGIFCEGGISRTGQILPFKRGLEWLLERVESPLEPVSIDGMWGSLLSFSEGRFFSKWPRGLRRPLTLTFGPVLPAGTHPDAARRALQEVAAAAMRRRLEARRGTRGPGWTDLAMTAEAFDGCCLVRRTDRLVSSLAAGDPLQEALGVHGGTLLGIPVGTLDAALPAAEIRAGLRRAQATIWLARSGQVRDLAALVAAAPGNTSLAPLEAVVIPLDDPGSLPAAEEAISAFESACGIQPVVAYAPRDHAGRLVSMNTPPSRAADHEETCRRGTLGRVVNGAVVAGGGAWLGGTP